MARALRLLVILALTAGVWFFVDARNQRAINADDDDALGLAPLPAGRPDDAAPRPQDDPLDRELSAIRSLTDADEAQAIARYEALVLKLEGARRTSVACELAVRLNNRATRAARASEEKAADVDSARALTLCPKDETLRKNRAAILFSFAFREDRKTTDSRARARERLDLGLAVQENPDALVARAEIRYADNDVAGAVEDYQRALSLQDKDGWRTRLADLEKKAAVEGGFSDRKHQHFVARFEGYAQEKLAWLALDELEEAYFSIGRALDLYPKEPFTVLIYTGDQYARAIDVPDWSTGVFDGKIRVAQGQLAQERGTLRGILRHEYTHAVLSTLPARVPTWMNEGLAEYFEGTDADRALAECVRQKADGTVVSWEELNGAFVSISDKKRAGLAYATSTALVAALVDARGSYALVTFITQMESGASFEDAFLSTFAVSPRAHFDRFSADL